MKEDIIAAQQFEGDLYIKASDHHRVVRAKVAAEREACAMECIKLAHHWTRLGAWGENNEFHDCAAAIRARGQA
jgi:hypothetical protein